MRLWTLINDMPPKEISFVSFAIAFAFALRIFIPLRTAKNRNSFACIISILSALLFVLSCWPLVSHEFHMPEYAQTMRKSIKFN